MAQMFPDNRGKLSSSGWLPIPRKPLRIKLKGAIDESSTRVVYVFGKWAQGSALMDLMYVFHKLSIWDIWIGENSYGTKINKIRS